MQLYRICPEAFLENYSGEGASFRSGGRWNQPGQRVLYFASSAAVAMLEVANYLPSPALCAQKLPAWAISTARCAGQPLPGHCSQRLGQFSVSGQHPTTWQRLAAKPTKRAAGTTQRNSAARPWQHSAI